MSTTSTGSERRVRFGLRVWLALAFGAIAAALCVALAFAIGKRASDVVEQETGRYLARLAVEYRDAAVPGDLDAARRARVAIESSVDPALPVELMLVDSDGTVLVGPASLEGAGVLLNGGSAVAVQRWPDGEHYLVAVTDRTIARARADAAFAGVAELRRAILWAGLFLALAGIAAGWILATRHVRPLEALTRAAQQIAAGNDRVDLPPLDDNHEVQQLADALRAMLSRLRAQAESLRDAQDRLQRRVHERTAELVKVQAQLQLEVAEAKLARDELARALNGEKNENDAFIAGAGAVGMHGR